MNTLSRLIVVAVLPAPLLAQSQGPWAKVPALPTGCYNAPDSAWYNTVARDKAALEQEIEKQEAANTAVSDAFKDQDPAAKQAAIQAAMMKDPQGAMKAMQAIQQEGTDEKQAARMAVAEREATWNPEFDTLSMKYRAALGAAVDPIAKKMNAVHSGEGMTAADEAAVKAFQKEADAAYAKVCAQWFQANGTFTKWLATYKDFLVKERLPYWESEFSAQKGMFGFFGMNVANYKSYDAQKAATDYLEMARRVFVQREGDVFQTK